MTGNQYKIQIARTAVKRAILALPRGLSLWKYQSHNRRS